MPMLAGYESIREVVARAIAAGGASMRRLEHALPDAEWQCWLIESVHRAQFVLADMTDHNPFVMYELGLAHTRRLPTLLMVDSRNERIPATVLGTPFLTYDNRDLGRFEAELARRIAIAVDERRRPAARKLCLRLAGDRPYERALDLLRAFLAEARVEAEAVSHYEFATRLTVAEGRGDSLPAGSNGQRVAWYLLPRIIRDSDRTRIMQAIEAWSRSAPSLR
jgi:hypothetical protein